MLFFRIFQHLLPTGAAWRTTIQKTLRKFFEGLAGAPEDARDFVDTVYAEIAPATTTELATWQKQFGIEPAGDEATQRLALAAEWAATGGQDPTYIQNVLQAAGFPVFVHDWWVPPDVAPRTARNPLDYTDQPLIGTVQCGEPWAQCGENAAQCNRFLVNDPHYLVNKDLTNQAPPPIPNDPDRWPYFMYIGGEVFGDFVTIDASRRSELERLILKIRPTHLWVVTLINYAASSGDSFYFDGGAGFDHGRWVS